MSNTYLSRTTDASGNSNQKKWTLSAWVKRSKLGAHQMIMAGGAGSYYTHLYFRSDDKFAVYNHANSGSHNYEGVTSSVYRDTNAWYHIVIRSDTANSTAGERCRFYVNGEQVTLSANPSQNINYELTGANNPMQIGVRLAPSTGDYFDGSMSHIHFCDEQSYAPTEFGETDTTTGEWKIKTSPSVTYGNHGFFILKDTNSGTDQSGQSHNFAISGTLTKTEDCPSNVFSTWNSLLSYGSTMSLANGNTTGNTSSSHEGGKFLSFYTSLGMTSGKYYAEFKITSNANQSLIGISSNFEDDILGSSSSAYNFIYKGNGWGYSGANGKIFHTNSNTQMTYGNSLSNNDILGVALDLDNLKLYFSKNGTFQNSANPVTGSGDVVSAGAKALNGSGSTGTYFFSCADTDQSAVCNIQANFGNGYFGTTAITTNSGNGYSGAEGSSKFNYTVPSGYSALSTKGLNE